MAAAEIGKRQSGEKRLFFESESSVEEGGDIHDADFGRGDEIG